MSITTVVWIALACLSGGALLGFELALMFDRIERRDGGSGVIALPEDTPPVPVGPPRREAPLHKACEAEAIARRVMSASHTRYRYVTSQEAQAIIHALLTERESP